MSRMDENKLWLHVAVMSSIVIWQGACTATLLGQSNSQRGAARKTTRARTSSNQTANGQSASTKGEKPDIVAVVNGQSITRQELAQHCLTRYGEQVLESLVNKHLILQACRQQKIRITNQHIEDEIAQISTRFNLDKDRWLTMLQQERGISPEQYRRDIIWPTLALKKLAADRLEVSDAELKREFESEYGAKVQARMIAVSNQAKAQQILAEVRAAPDQFGVLAKKYSEDPNSAATRGLIPHVRKHVGDPKVEQAVFALKPGGISPIVEVAGQFLIFKCEKQLPATPISPAYRKMANTQLRERIVDRNLRDASTQIFQKLQSSATIVNVLNDAEKRKQYPGVAAVINGQQITVRQLAEECIERHGRDVLESEVNHKLLRQALKRAGKKVTEADIDTEVARAAEAYGFVKRDDTPDVTRWLKQVTDQEGMDVKTYVRDAVWPSVALKKLVSDEVKVSEDDLNRGFEANYGERVEVLAIVVGNQRVAQEVWDLARGRPTANFFGELAAQYSIEPVSRANLGEVPPVRKFSGQPKIEQEAFSLTKQDPLSAIVAIADKYVIMFFKGRTKRYVERLEDVRDELGKDLKEKKMRVAMAQRFDDLRESAQVDNFLAGTSQSGRRPPQPREAAERETARRRTPTSPKLIRPASQRRPAKR